MAETKKKAKSDKLTLGGGIVLEGFLAVDISSMVIVKKMVGSFVKIIADKNKDFEKLSMVITDDAKHLTAELTIGGKTKKVETDVDNVFVAMNKLFKQLE